MSVTHVVFGAVTVNCRSSTVAATGSPCRASVVVWNRRFFRARRPCCCIKRATRCRPALRGRRRAGAPPPGLALSLPHPCAQRCLGEIELPGDRPEALLAPLHQPDRLRLKLRRERSPLPPSLLSHDTLLSHFRASWGVHETGASSEPCSTRLDSPGLPYGSLALHVA